MDRPPIDENDPIEKMGGRIGRALAYAAVPVLVFALGRSLGWW